jgi:hypothetical protein
MVPGVAVRLAAGTEQTKMSNSGQGEANRAWKAEQGTRRRIYRPSRERREMRRCLSRSSSVSHHWHHYSGRNGRLNGARAGRSNWRRDGSNGEETVVINGLNGARAGRSNGRRDGCNGEETDGYVVGRGEKGEGAVRKWWRFSGRAAFCGGEGALRRWGGEEWQQTTFVARGLQRTAGTGRWRSTWRVGPLRHSKKERGRVGHVGLQAERAMCIFFSICFFFLKKEASVCAFCFWFFFF